MQTWTEDDQEHLQFMQQHELEFYQTHRVKLNDDYREMLDLSIIAFRSDHTGTAIRLYDYCCHDNKDNSNCNNKYKDNDFWNAQKHF
ncbi:hypothetical protein ccbrp13_49740 [Ktedonobacteria bacterium brp13]|nr:hypothetical protein ccbrp13_49740 [Ktedonobacteria bacterium brp13]